jgi:hypothetical protein
LRSGPRVTGIGVARPRAGHIPIAMGDKLVDRAMTELGIWSDKPINARLVLVWATLNTVLAVIAVVVHTYDNARA